MEVNSKKGYFLVFLTAFISGVSIFINKFGVAFNNPYLFTWLKNLIVGLFLGGIIFFSPERNNLKKVKKKDWFLLLLVGLIGGAIPFLLFFKGLSLIHPSWASFWHKTIFLYVAPLAYFFLKEKISKNYFWGAGFFLIINLLLLKDFFKSDLEIFKGHYLVILAAVFWAIENVISKHLLKKLSGPTVAWGRMFFGSLFIFLFLLLSNQIIELKNLSLAQVKWIFITSLFLLGYVLGWYSGLKFIPVSQASAILLFGSFISTLLDFIFLKNGNIETLILSFLIIPILCIILISKAPQRIKNFS